MAFLDFMNGGIGGMTAPQTQPGIAGEGDVVTQPAKPIGPTWNDLAKAAMINGSKPGSSAPMVAQGMPSSGFNQNTLQPLTAAQMQQQKGDTNDQGFSQMIQALTKMFGGA